MNDRFNFRVWYGGRFVYKNLCDACVYTEDDKCISLANILPTDLKWEQCTEFRDKNGKLIYEGDILFVQALDWHKKERWDCETIRTYWSVEYKNYWNHCGFMVFGINRRFHKPLTRTVIFNSEAEVIGNIHQNPELLKESK